jgi:[acyl-carrier-protein] S-malonyltransferase
MASVLGADAPLVEKICAECGIDAANLNCPGQIVISGESDNLAIAVTKLKENGVKKIIPLKVAGAYHSRLMSPSATKFASELEKIKLEVPKLPVAQNFTGKINDNTNEIKSNLEKQICGTVRWEDCVKTICSQNIDGLIEFGPGNVLTGLAKRIMPDLKTFNINSAKSLEEFKNFNK